MGDPVPAGLKAGKLACAAVIETPEQALMYSKMARWLTKRGKVVVPRLSEARKQELRDCFELMDKDHSGSVDVQELKCAFKLLGIRSTDKQTAELVKEVDRDGNNELEWPEFAAVMGEVLIKDQMGASKPNRETTSGNGQLPFELVSTAYRRKCYLESVVSHDKEAVSQMVALLQSGARPWAQAASRDSETTASATAKDSSTSQRVSDDNRPSPLPAGSDPATDTAAPSHAPGRTPRRTSWASSHHRAIVKLGAVQVDTDLLMVAHMDAYQRALIAKGSPAIIHPHPSGSPQLAPWSGTRPAAARTTPRGATHVRPALAAALASVGLTPTAPAYEPPGWGPSPRHSNDAAPDAWTPLSPRTYYSHAAQAVVQQGGPGVHGNGGNGTPCGLSPRASPHRPSGSATGPLRRTASLQGTSTRSTAAAPAPASRHSASNSMPAGLISSAASGGATTGFTSAAKRPPAVLLTAMYGEGDTGATTCSPDHHHDRASMGSSTPRSPSKPYPLACGSPRQAAGTASGWVSPRASAVHRAVGEVLLSPRLGGAGASSLRTPRGPRYSDSTAQGHAITHVATSTVQLPHTARPVSARAAVAAREARAQHYAQQAASETSPRHLTCDPTRMGSPCADSTTASSPPNLIPPVSAKGPVNCTAMAPATDGGPAHVSTPHQAVPRDSTLASEIAPPALHPSTGLVGTSPTKPSVPRLQLGKLCIAIPVADDLEHQGSSSSPPAVSVQATAAPGPAATSPTEATAQLPVHVQLLSARSRLPHAHDGKDGFAGFMRHSAREAARVVGAWTAAAGTPGPGVSGVSSPRVTHPVGFATFLQLLAPSEEAQAPGQSVSGVRSPTAAAVAADTASRRLQRTTSGVHGSLRRTLSKAGSVSPRCVDGGSFSPPQSALFSPRVVPTTPTRLSKVCAADLQQQEAAQRSMVGHVMLLAARNPRPAPASSERTVPASQPLG